MNKSWRMLPGVLLVTGFAIILGACGGGGGSGSVSANGGGLTLRKL